MYILLGLIDWRYSKYLIMVTIIDRVINRHQVWSELQLANVFLSIRVFELVGGKLIDAAGVMINSTFLVNSRQLIHTISYFERHLKALKNNIRWHNLLI